MILNDFSKYFRMNLDPRNHFSDSDIWRALDTSQLTSAVRQLPHQLGTVHIQFNSSLPANRLLDFEFR